MTSIFIRRLPKVGTYDEQLQAHGVSLCIHRNHRINNSVSFGHAFAEQAGFYFDGRIVLLDFDLEIRSVPKLLQQSALHLTCANSRFAQWPHKNPQKRSIKNRISRPIPALNSQSLFDIFLVSHAMRHPHANTESLTHSGGFYAHPRFLLIANGR
jgi:hypothetical protein